MYNHMKQVCVSPVYISEAFHLSVVNCLTENVNVPPKAQKVIRRIKDRTGKKRPGIIIFTQLVIQQKLSLFLSQNIRCHHDNLL